eukprot:Gregarina_sp_Poly_1__6917@NODE_3755_length_895_cov_496_361111_g2410_i0_p1_GENE_NODE_3755_length_895_cov_496_361111_g2410_i0NODE_3755_length_895_cov_496_361111_g2410_i0_p1_ORF_typecomplete_len203_score34_17EFhand_7/PF13499_6/76EFhand_7/PF13499_6/8e11EFhand_11/PF08976_11/1_6e08EFhand_6/PF13405_6/1_3e06EFhand_6/PF13405_6/6_2e03EFhand_8/PF13833_6/6e02EFhand_8/PF13833_6/1_5EFhand_8/PF13833_6/0_0016EFhand_1/PF00036_32/0_013EFhand_1/PF00036_32/1_8e02SPARC_Ca_bdg/PF10591_9/5_6e03SPARC_Ca_bdg/PF10591_9/0
MALICKDVCRECLPGQEYFEYGLWMPADKYRPDSDDEASSEDQSGSSESSSGVDAKKLEAENAAKVNQAKSKLNDNFNKVSGGGSNVTAAQAGDVARLLGFAPSQEEIRQLKEAKGDSVTQSDVEAWLVTIAHADDSVDHLVSFFQYYDTNKNGKLSKSQIKNLLRSYGEPLTDAEIDAILSEFGMTGESIDYREFVTKLLG